MRGPARGRRGRGEVAEVGAPLAEEVPLRVEHVGEDVGRGPLLAGTLPVPAVRGPDHLGEAVGVGQVVLDACVHVLRVARRPAPALERIRHVPEPIDPTERAHLRDDEGYSPPIFRFAPSPGLADVVRRYWLPVWDLPAGRTTVQRVLQYPVVMIVVTADYARCIGPSTGLSTQELGGRGWAVGAMGQPATGALVLGRPVSEITDRLRRPRCGPRPRRRPG